jgi:predicted PurR-regulated permease PerM
MDEPRGPPAPTDPVAADPVPLPRAAAWTGLAVLAVLLLVLAMHLLWALLSALATYSLSRALMRRLQPRLPHRAAAAVSVIVTLTLLAALAEAGIAAVHATWVPSGGLPRLLATLADTLDKLQSWLPEWIASRIPASTEDLRRVASEWLRSNAHQLRNWGHSGLRIVAQLLLGFIVGMLAAHERHPPWRATWARRVQEALDHLVAAFAGIVSAQLRISAANTLFTAIFLLVALPLAGYHMPLAASLVVFTFVTGFIPVVGNLASNGAIVLLGLTVSPGVGLAALVFLLVIHKLEYFLNAHFVGTRTEVPAAVLVAAMLLLEACFGIGGVVAAPIYCAWAFRQFGLLPASPGLPRLAS